MADASRKRASIRALGDGFFGVWSVFEDKDAVKALPGARWDGKLKCWRVPEMFRDEAAKLVDRLNGNLDTNLFDHLVAILRAVPESHREATYKALVKVWHPDAGGNTRATQTLNAAWNEVKP